MLLRADELSKDHPYGLMHRDCLLVFGAVQQRVVGGDGPLSLARPGRIPGLRAATDCQHRSRHETRTLHVILLVDPCKPFSSRNLAPRPLPHAPFSMA